MPAVGAHALQATTFERTNTLVRGLRHLSTHSICNVLTIPMMNGAVDPDWLRNSHRAEAHDCVYLWVEIYL